MKVNSDSWDWNTVYYRKTSDECFQIRYCSKTTSQTHATFAIYEYISSLMSAFPVCILV